MLTTSSDLRRTAQGGLRRNDMLSATIAGNEERLMMRVTINAILSCTAAAGVDIDPDKAV